MKSNTKGVVIFSKTDSEVFRKEMNINDDTPLFFNKRSNVNKLHLYKNQWQDFVFYQTKQIYKTLPETGSETIEIEKVVIYITTKV